MHRAYLADVAGPKRLHHPIGLQQCPPESLRVGGIIVHVGSVLLERHRVLDLAWHRPDVHLDPEATQSIHECRIEVRDRHRGKREPLDAAVVGRDDQPVVDEVERDLERPRAMAYWRGRKPARRHIERDVPPVVHQRRGGQPDFADDLSPKVKSVTGLAPGRERQVRPSRGVIHPDSHSLIIGPVSPAACPSRR